MSTQIKTKINQLVSQWPRGAVFAQRYLNKIGYNRHLMRRYRAGNWVESIGAGAYKLAGDEIQWHGGLFALQTQLELPVHVGARTALEYQGAAHYLRFHEHVVYLFASAQAKLPKWFVQYNWRVTIEQSFSNFVPFDLEKSFAEITYRDFHVRVSTPERAVLEMLYLVPRKQGFDEALKIMEGMMTLRPQLMQQLLESCRSIKVKRLALYMAEKCQLPWVKRLDLSKIELGNGKRLIIKGGQLDKKYLITVPRETGSE